MPGDVGIQFSVEGAGDVVQAFNQTTQASQQFAQNTTQTVTSARTATMGLSIAIMEVSRIARLEGGPSGVAFAKSLDLVIAGSLAARGAIGLWRAELQIHTLITRAATATTEAFNAASSALVGPFGLMLLAVAAVTAGLVLYAKHLRDVEGPQERLRVQQEILANEFEGTAEAIDKELVSYEILTQTEKRLAAQRK